MAEISRSVMIVNELGLHARAASKLVQMASQYTVEVDIGRSDMMVNSKSIMGVLMLAACKGTELVLTARGDEALCHEALDNLSALIADRFGEGK
jgi:phosphocarrier protein